MRNRALLLLMFMATTLRAAGVTVLFNPADPATGPYPSEVLTVADSAQKTGRRINLPKTDCAADPLSCIVQPALNQLDGFNLQPRIRVRFSGAIDPATLRNAIFYVALDNLAAGERGLHKPGDLIVINEVVYDPGTFSVFAKPDTFLDQHRRYALVVTTNVRDSAGVAVGASPAFAACADNSSLPGCPRATDFGMIAAAGIPPSTIAGASVFNTVSATAWLERARDLLPAIDPSFKRGPVVDLSQYPTAVWHQQTGASPVAFTDQPLPFALLPGVSRIAFGTFASPSYLNAAQTIDMPGTGVPLPPVRRVEQIPFNVYLPVGPKPPAGYPVAIFGHGFGSDRLVSPAAMASSFAAAGWAVIGIDAVGHGFGPQSGVTFSGPKGTLEVAVPGRGVPQGSAGSIGSTDGCLILVPVPVGGRDCILQTALDLNQLTRLLRSGVDLDGDGMPDLDPARVVYTGHSLGADYGAVFSAVEPTIGLAALASGGGTTVTATRMSPSFIPLLTQYFGAVAPSLLNAGKAFNGNWPLRNEAVRVNTVKGAIEVQEAFEKVEWLSSPGEALNFAMHLKSSPLTGVPSKQVLFQFPIGDRTDPNPTESALVRSADMRDTTRIYHAELAYAANPAIPVNPHAFILDLITSANAPIALAAQSQVIGFLVSGGATIPDPSAALAKLLGVSGLFEAPRFLPETLNFYGPQ